MPIPTMTLTEQLVTIAMVVLGTMATRFVVFLVFRKGRKTPDYIRYLGKMLPAAAFGMLVVYCYRHVDFLAGRHGLPELAAGLLTAGLHLWRRNMLVSMAGGTVFYMAVLRVLA